jgi:hypothetical protein
MERKATVHNHINSNLDKIIKEYLDSFKDDDFILQMSPKELEEEKERIHKLREVNYENTTRL